jgi:hypothetical protein
MKNKVVPFVFLFKTLFTNHIAINRCSPISMNNNVNTGWVYCLSNKAMPGIYKIGKTKISPEERAKQLYTTGVPYPFKIEFAKYVTEYHKKEKSFQKILNQYSCNQSREFFEVDIAIIMELFYIIEEYKITKKNK